LILDEKKRLVPAKFAPSARHFLRGSFRAAVAATPAKTIYQPCGQRNERAAPRIGFAVRRRYCLALTRFRAAAARPIFTAASDTGLR